MGSKQSVIEGAQTDCKPKLVHKVFEESLNENSKNRPALFYHDSADTVRVTNFDELNKNANRLAAYILQAIHGTNAKTNQDGDYVIAVCMTTNDNVIATLLAIWKVGATYLSLDPTFPRNRIVHMVGETKPLLVIYDEYNDLSVFQNTNSIAFNDLLAKSSCFSEENIHIQSSLSRGDEDVAIILYTSGSTGIPKGVRIPHSAVLNKLRWLQSTFPYSASEKVCTLTSSLINVDSVAELWGPLLNEVAVLVIPQEVTTNIYKLVVLLESYKVERLILVPVLLTSILTYLPLQNNRLLRNLKTWISCGETLTTSLATEFFKYFNDGTHRLCNFYGCTEVMGDVTYYVCENIEQVAGLTKVPIGLPIDNTAIFLMDDHLNPIKNGERGEIFVAGLSLAMGYVNGREKSKFIHNRFTDNPKFNRLYRTGDFAQLLKDGSIQYEGRKDAQIKVRGNRLNITEIERVLRSVQSVEKGVVLCYHTGKKDQAVIAFVVLKDDIGLLSEYDITIQNILKTELLDYQIPVVKIIKSIPLLSNGKIDRETLLKIYENNSTGSDINYDYTDVNEDQLQMAEDVLPIIGSFSKYSSNATMSIRSDFHELGINIDNFILVVTQLRDKGYFIAVNDFIAANCVGDVLNQIYENSQKKIIEEKFTQYKSIPLTTHHKYQTIAIITSCYYDNSELGVYLLEKTQYSDPKEIVELIWDYTLEKALSYAITDNDNNIIGISINFDCYDEPKIVLKSNLSIIFDFLESLEKPIREKELPQGKNKVFHAFLMGTSAKLTTEETIVVTQKMEEVNLELAARKGFAGILVTNVSPLIQQFGSLLYGYRTMVEYQVNKYVHHDGSRPFNEAPDTQLVIVHWKEITQE